jgi:hypothetical protein
MMEGSLLGAKQVPTQTQLEEAGSDLAVTPLPPRMIDLQLLNDFQSAYMRNNKTKTKKHFRCFPACAATGKQLKQQIFFWALTFEHQDTTTRGSVDNRFVSRSSLLWLIQRGYGHSLFSGEPSAVLMSQDA